MAVVGWPAIRTSRSWTLWNCGPLTSGNRVAMMTYGRFLLAFAERLGPGVEIAHNTVHDGLVHVVPLTRAGV
jgi:hypothetical protein